MEAQGAGGRIGAESRPPEGHPRRRCGNPPGSSQAPAARRADGRGLLLLPPPASQSLLPPADGAQKEHGEVRGLGCEQNLYI